MLDKLLALMVTLGDGCCDLDEFTDGDDDEPRVNERTSLAFRLLPPDPPPRPPPPLPPPLPCDDEDDLDLDDPD